MGDCPATGGRWLDGGGDGEGSGARPSGVLNIADPDCPNGRRIASIVANYLGHAWEEVLLDASDTSGLGAHPWDALPPVVLDCAAARQLGYQPAGDYETTVTDELDWLVAHANATAGSQPPGTDDPYFSKLTDYAREDIFLAQLGA